MLAAPDEEGGGFCFDGTQSSERNSIHEMPAAQAEQPVGDPMGRTGFLIARRCISSMAEFGMRIVAEK